MSESAASPSRVEVAVVEAVLRTLDLASVDLGHGLFFGRDHRVAPFIQSAMAGADRAVLRPDHPTSGAA